VPEGDTIHRTASALRTALVGHRISSFNAPRLVGPVPEIGRVVEAVTSHGKHLEIRWDDDLVLHTHLKMSGSWHLYRSGERWRKPHRNLRVSIETENWTAVCFSAPVVETYRSADRTRHPAMGRLGPNLCDRRANLGIAVDRLMQYPDPEAFLAEVLLDQRVFCGVGNVYRSEVLWTLQVSPWARVSELDEYAAEVLVKTSAEMLRSNLHRVERITTPEAPSGLAVYGRNGQGCLRCHDTIRMHRVGHLARSVFWCDGCQTYLDSRPIVATDAMDPHPAATRFLAELPWRDQDVV